MITPFVSVRRNGVPLAHDFSFVFVPFYTFESGNTLLRLRHNQRRRFLTKFHLSDKKSFIYFPILGGNYHCNILSCLLFFLASSLHGWSPYHDTTLPDSWCNVLRPCNEFLARLYEFYFYPLKSLGSDGGSRERLLLPFVSFYLVLDVIECIGAVLENHISPVSCRDDVWINHETTMCWIMGTTR